MNSVFICLKRSSFIHSNFSWCSVLAVFPALYQWEPWMVYVLLDICPKIYICLFLAFYITLTMRLLVNFLTVASQTSLIMYIGTPNWCASSFVIINSQGRFLLSPQQKLRLRQTGFLVFSLFQWVFCFCFCFLVNPFIDYGFKKGALHNLEGWKWFQCPTLLKPYFLVAVSHKRLWEWQMPQCYFSISSPFWFSTPWPLLSSRNFSFCKFSYAFQGMFLFIQHL